MGKRVKAGRMTAAGGVDASTMARVFERYKPETEHPVRPVEVKETKALKQLKEAWKRFAPTEKELDAASFDHPNVYNQALAALRGCRYRATDIESFSLAMKAFESEPYFNYKAGNFLSALINTGKGRRYTIWTKHLNEEIYMFGCLNRKNIIVNGGTGEFTGFEMSGGCMEIHGNVTGTYNLNGGKIIIHGNLQTLGPVSGDEIVVWGKLSALVSEDCFQKGTITIKGMDF